MYRLALFCYVWNVKRFPVLGSVFEKYSGMAGLMWAHVAQDKGRLGS